jgi:hypothetical protein
MHILLLLSALALPARQPAVATIATAASARISVTADSDSVVMAKIMTDMAAAMAEVARRNGFEQAAQPAGWLEPAYLAAATDRADVPDYFMRYGAYAEDLDLHVDSIAASIAKRRFHEGGYDPKTELEMRAAFMRGFEKTRERQRLMFTAMRRQATIALRLHEFLVKVDARVAVDPKDNKLVFDRPLEHRRYNELAIAIDAANDEVAQLSGQAPATASTQP